MKRILVAGACLLASTAAPVLAQTGATGQASIVTADKVQWMDAPQFGPGVQAATLAGNPAQSEPYVVRLKLPANLAVPPHTHPGTENVTVLSGRLNLGMGESFDQTKGQQLGSGSFFTIPANTPHFAWASEETVIQIHGMGPSAIKFIESASGSSGK
jgi:quercetin dioxygenase-like cupin family protein